MDLYSLIWSTEATDFHLTHIQSISSIILAVTCLGIIVATMFSLIREHIVTKKIEDV